MSSEPPVDPYTVNPVYCYDVTPECPVEASIYGYYVNLPVTIFFVVLFGVCVPANIYFGIKYKTWTYLLAMGLANLCSAIGYAGRIPLHTNPFYTLGFQMQICCLTFSPALNSAALYLMLKHHVRRFGREWSRIRPRWYTWGFITADFMALGLQAAGGGLSASAGSNYPLLMTGERLMIAGVAWQVLTLLVFGAMIVDYGVRRRKSHVPLSEEALATLNNKKFRIFVVAMAISYFCILTRCVYRIAEMAGGWKNPIMQDQWLFVGLESSIVGVASLLQTFVHPGYCFGSMKKIRASPVVTHYSEDSEKNMSEMIEEKNISETSEEHEVK